MRFEGLVQKSNGSGFTARDNDMGGVAMQASWDLFLIAEAWRRGMDVEDLADGFGEGNGTMGGDWSGIRDSSEEAKERMLERALNFLFPVQRG